MNVFDNQYLMQALAAQLLTGQQHYQHGINLVKYHKNYWDNDRLIVDEKLTIKEADFWLAKPWEELRAFLHWKAQYFLPTLESIDLIKDIILTECDLSDAIEIGAGNGWLGYHLGIKMTDSMIQDDPSVKDKYDTAKQPRITYGKDVEKLEASEAIAKYKPHTVIGSWITQSFKNDGTDIMGSEWGVDEEHIIKNCKRYILIGSIPIHQTKRILKLNHIEFENRSLISRTKNHELNRIWIFNG
jgi:hypothetical protein